MALSIEVFYSFSSPYSYLALESIYDLERDFDVELLWQPFSPKAADDHPKPHSINPDKLSYLIEDIRRYAKEHNIPLTLPESWPQSEYDPTRVTRGALVARDLNCLMEYNYKVFHKWWGEGQDPNEENFFSELCDELDVELGDFLSKMASSDTRERVKGIYKRGAKLGVFDTPMLIIDKERFFGLDKLPYIRNRLVAMDLKVANNY